MTNEYDDKKYTGFKLWFIWLCVFLFGVIFWVGIYYLTIYLL